MTHLNHQKKHIEGREPFIDVLSDTHTAKALREQVSWSVSKTLKINLIESKIYKGEEAKKTIALLQEDFLLRMRVVIWSSNFMKRKIPRDILSHWNIESLWELTGLNLNTSGEFNGNLYLAEAIKNDGSLEIEENLSLAFLEKWKTLVQKIDIHWDCINPNNVEYFPDFINNLELIESKRIESKRLEDGTELVKSRGGFNERVFREIKFLSRLHMLCYPEVYIEKESSAKPAENPSKGSIGIQHDSNTWKLV